MDARTAHRCGRAIASSDDVELGEAGGLAYRSAASGRPLVWFVEPPGRHWSTTARRLAESDVSA